jgi:hypothetical protein
MIFLESFRSSPRTGAKELKEVMGVHTKPCARGR